MFSSPQNLRIRRPSPTTVEFKVSTRSPQSTIFSYILFVLIFLLRLLLGSLVLLASFVKWSDFMNYKSTSGHAILESYPGRVAISISNYLSWQYYIPSAVAVSFLVFRRGYTEESLLVLRGLGIQTSTSSSTYLSTAKTRFIPTKSIQDIFINEAFLGFEVRFYLAVVVEGEPEVVVVFPSLLPKRKLLEQVWRGARSCLYEPKL